MISNHKWQNSENTEKSASEIKEIIRNEEHTQQTRKIEANTENSTVVLCASDEHWER